MYNLPGRSQFFFFVLQNQMTVKLDFGRKENCKGCTKSLCFALFTMYNQCVGACSRSMYQSRPARGPRSLAGPLLSRPCGAADRRSVQAPPIDGSTSVLEWGMQHFFLVALRPDAPLQYRQQGTRSYPQKQLQHLR